jgi:hypothetical protein
MKPIEKSPERQPEKKGIRKTYGDRLKYLNLPESPEKPHSKQIRQFQLAHLAATLGKSSEGKISPSESAALALQFWNAAGKALSIENQARVLTRGIFVFQRKEWEAHAKALIAYFDDCDGAVPGQNDSEETNKCYCNAQKKAGRAVVEVWEGMHRHEFFKALFPGKNGTEKTREAEFVKLLQYAKTSVDKDNSLDLQSDGENRLKASLVRAWFPLELMDEGKNLYGSGIKQIQALLNKPEIASNNQLVAVNGQVVRWLAVMRQIQLSSNMKR